MIIWRDRVVFCLFVGFFFFFKQKTAYEMRISDWSSDVCSSDLKAGVQVEDFIGGIVELGDRLGPLVWQFDRGTKIDADDFAAFLGLLPKKAGGRALRHVLDVRDPDLDRKSTRLNSSH